MQTSSAMAGLRSHILFLAFLWVFVSFANPPEKSKRPLNATDEFTLSMVKGIAVFPFTQFGARLSGTLWLLNNHEQIAQAVPHPLMLTPSPKTLEKIGNQTNRSHAAFDVPAISPDELKAFIHNFPMTAAEGINNLFFQSNDPWLALLQFARRPVTPAETAYRQGVMEDLQALYESLKESEVMRRFRTAVAKHREDLWESFRPMITQSAWNSFQKQRPQTCEETYYGLIEAMSFPYGI